MTTPDFSHLNLKKSDAEFDAASDATEFGPDVTAIPEQPFDNLKAKKASAPKGRPGTRSAGSVFGKLGQNKKSRSTARALVLADKEKIANLYVYGSMGIMPFKQDTAMAMANSAEACADAWFDLAKENDTVRRAILAMIEGGVWGKVFFAHMPILVSLIPGDVMASRFGALFGANGEVPEDHPENLN